MTATQWEIDVRRRLADELRAEANLMDEEAARYRAMADALDTRTDLMEESR